MGQKVRHEGSPNSGIFSFYCPGCEHLHCYWTRQNSPFPSNPVWKFNGNLYKPTFSPSLKNTWGKHADPKFNIAELTLEEVLSPRWSGICHLFLTEGRLQFCGDCTHSFRNLTVDCPNHPGVPADPRSN